ncbi:uncharacterized protein LOC117173810 [Belonocnema kinseyi]|uniref:uncharacterized protein LOC117173810 n=1 Tax=Belonocnema kinseyi TaxID=2817044 RepID=UPI00143CF9D3|nr:uncharacterized protein LOC117173810 [Belonocnema kinseyi]
MCCHIEFSSQPVQTAQVQEPEKKTKIVLAVTHDAEVLLGTAVVNIFDIYNKPHTCRLLLDGGSQPNFISEKLASKLKLDQIKIDMPFGGLGQLVTRANYKVKAKIQSRINACEHEIELVALPTITSLLPSRFVDKGSLSLPHGIKLAYPEFNKPAEIDILIGATLYYKLLSTGQIVMKEQPNVTLQKTLLGWIIAGEVAVKQSASPRACHLVTLDSKITRFWEIDSIPQKKLLSLDEQKCEKFYSETTTRRSDGVYVVRLPFNDQRDKLGNNYYNALNRAYSQERKLSKNPSLKEAYTGKLCRYRDLGHLREITNTNTRDQGYYIPHLDVTKRDYEASRLKRIVFDGSHNIVLAGDLQKMFRCIQVHEDDVKYQKIPWRNDSSEQMRVFVLTTVTQGTACAPYLAARTLHQLEIDEGGRYPQAAQFLKNDFYVDDLLTGASSLEAAVELKDKLEKLLELGGFKFHKWTSNEPSLSSQSNSSDESNKADAEAEAAISDNSMSNETQKQHRKRLQVILEQLSINSKDWGSHRKQRTLH